MINIPEDKFELTRKWIARAHESSNTALGCEQEDLGGAAAAF